MFKKELQKTVWSGNQWKLYLKNNKQKHEKTVWSEDQWNIFQKKKTILTKESGSGLANLAGGFI